MNKAIFLDRDGTINVEKNYLYKIEDFEFLPGVIDGLKLLQDAGYLLIIITNQSGIGRGYYTERDFKLLNDWMISFLNEKGVIISQVYYCPHLPNALIEEYRMDCECRKPKLGLFYEAVKDFDLDISKCYSIGDKIRDCAICQYTSCRGFLIGTNETPSIISKVMNNNYQNIKYEMSLLKCAERIIYGV